MRSASPPGGGSCRSAPRLRLRYFRVGGSLATGRPLPGPVMDRLHLDAALLGDPPLRGQMLQRVDRGADHVVRDGAAGERDLHHPPARGLDRLAHRLAYLVGLPGRDADPSLPIADGHERVEPEAPAALDDFGDAVDRDHVLDEAIPFALPLPTVAALAPPPWPAPPATAAPPTATTPPT